MPRATIDAQTVDRIQYLRRGGFSFGEIAKALGLPKSAVIYYSAAIRVQENGHNELLRILSDLATALEPGEPFKEPPLPNIVIAKLQRLHEIMRQ
jgi:hypothetical protein